MPIYEYRCGECGEKFDKWHRSMCCEEAARCPKCGSQRVKKAVSLFGTSAAAEDRYPIASCAPTTVAEASADESRELSVRSDARFAQSEKPMAVSEEVRQEMLARLRRIEGPDARGAAHGGGGARLRRDHPSAGVDPRRHARCERLSAQALCQRVLDHGRKRRRRRTSPSHELIELMLNARDRGPANKPGFCGKPGLCFYRRAGYAWPKVALCRWHNSRRRGKTVLERVAPVVRSLKVERRRSAKAQGCSGHGLFDPLTFHRRRSLQSRCRGGPQGLQVGVGPARQELAGRHEAELHLGIFQNSRGGSGVASSPARLEGMAMTRPLVSFRIVPPRRATSSPKPKGWAW